MIRLFDSATTIFTTLGIGALSDAISCVVTENRNGTYELEMEYTTDGKYYSEIQLRRIVFAKPNPYSNPQPFRVYNISKPINCVVTINAEHISYDLSGFPVSPFKATNSQDAFSKLKGYCVYDLPFTLTTDINDDSEMTIKLPSSVRSILGSRILEEYGGEYEFDMYDVKLLQNRGLNRGTSIRYGKNLLDLRQEENCSSVYTGVYPFWYSDESGLVELPEQVLNATGTYDFIKIFPLDLTDAFQNEPTEEELRTKATAFMTTYNIGIPKVALEVSFLMLAQTGEYENIANLEKVHLCDTVNVYFPKLGVNATAKCIQTKYNVITDKYESVQLGEAQSNVATTISYQKKAIGERPTKSSMAQAIDIATQLMTGGLGGHVIMRSSTGGKYPDEILIMDTDNVATATNVWRWNSGGFGFSSNGISGPYETAITMDGMIVAEFVKTGKLSADVIEGSLLDITGNASILSKAEVSYVNESIYDVQSQITANAEAILLKAESSVTDNLGDLISQNSAAIQVVDDRVTTEVSTLNDNLEEVKTYMEFDASGLTLGKSDSLLQIHISNQQMDFINNGSSVAYINGQKMFINSLDVTTSLLVGAHAIEKYDPTESDETNGDEITIVRWVGGNR